MELFTTAISQLVRVTLDGAYRFICGVLMVTSACGIFARGDSPIASGRPLSRLHQWVEAAGAPTSWIDSTASWIGKHPELVGTAATVVALAALTAICAGPSITRSRAYSTLGLTFVAASQAEVGTWTIVVLTVVIIAVAKYRRMYTIEEFVAGVAVAMLAAAAPLFWMVAESRPRSVGVADVEPTSLVNIAKAEPAPAALPRWSPRG